ncbi:MAG: DUF86 domain-containing protein [Proteobacteria bacterium]|nr:DUF86 domain-containing protein [Pseudomonadota bacterium]
MNLNHDLVRNRCREITESLTRLERIGAMSKVAFLQDQDAKDIASYRLLIAIEAALSICYHISSKHLKKVPENYADCFQLVGDAGIISAELSFNLQKMARFRNLLVHVYWEIDEEALYTIITSHLDDLRKYCQIIVGLL